MTEHTPTVTVRAGYEQIGPRPGLINADHHSLPSGGGWRRRGEAADGGRWVIPGLWRWGHIPQLTGQPKVGKTTAVVDLTASLLIPGRRFLDHFDSAGLTQDDRERGIWLINAETPPDDLNAELTDAFEGVPEEVCELLDVKHLQKEGGAATFDLTEPELFDQWAYNLTSCWECDRSDDWTPSVVIVDGLTAILAAAGKGVEHYSLWYAKFRSLMTELRVPNALVVGHSTLTGNHSMGGTEALAGPDGLWTYASDNVDNPRATRRFSVTPRMGGAVVPPLRVVRNESGRLVVPSGADSGGGDAEPAAGNADQQASKADAEDRVRVKLREAGTAGLRKTEVTGSGRLAYLPREALARLVTRGEVIEQPEGQGVRYWLAEAVPS